MKPIKGNTSQERSKEIFLKKKPEEFSKSGDQEPSKKVLITRGHTEGIGMSKKDLLKN
jgi:hypothetical protein